MWTPHLEGKRRQALLGLFSTLCGWSNPPWLQRWAVYSATVDAPTEGSNNRENPITFTSARESQPTSRTGRTTQDLSRDSIAVADPMKSFINCLFNLYVRRALFNGIDKKLMGKMSSLEALLLFLTLQVNSLELGLWYLNPSKSCSESSHDWSTSRLFG